MVCTTITITATKSASVIANTTGFAKTDLNYLPSCKITEDTTAGVHIRQEIKSTGRPIEFAINWSYKKDGYLQFGKYWFAIDTPDTTYFITFRVVNAVYSRGNYTELYSEISDVS